MHLHSTSKYYFLLLFPPSHVNCFRNSTLLLSTLVNTMAPKNKKKNSFYFFMKEIQDREAAKGVRMSINNMAQYAHPLWAKMDAAEREPYEELARKYKNDPNARGGKLAGDGTRVEDNLREMEEIERREKVMIQEIQRYVNVDCISKEQFKEFASRKMFYFVSFNILCQTETHYIPIEVGIIEYSIQHGIHREHHMLIHPGHIPTGYTGQAKILSEDLHQIDIFQGEPSSEKDMIKVYESIKHFVNPYNADELPPLFCIEDDIEKNVGCLKWLAARSRDHEVFDVWNVKYLLLELRAGAEEPLPSLIIANDLVTKTSFNYHSEARCDFHEEKDCHNCALAYCKRLGYLISDAVCRIFDVTLTERHMPSRTLEDKAYVVTMSNDASFYHKERFASQSSRLDQKTNYYQNDAGKVNDQFSDAPGDRKSMTPRQPASSCIAEEMNRLNLHMTAAPVPGHGIGRGQRMK